MKDIADAVIKLMRQGDYKACYPCTHQQTCENLSLFCANAIKAKMRGENTWKPLNKEGS